MSTVIAVLLWCVCVFSPSGPLEQFDSWLSTFSLEGKKAEISELLVNSPSIRALYTKMVRPAPLFPASPSTPQWNSPLGQNNVLFMQFNRSFL